MENTPCVNGSLILNILLKINVILNTEEPLKSSYVGIRKYCCSRKIDRNTTSSIFSWFSFPLIKIILPTSDDP